jgi:N-acyl homoserine lactone hydrolase
MADLTVRRVDFGYFIRPVEETGTGVPRVEPCLGYAVGHPEGMILFDTGMGSHPEVDAHYRPRRVGLPEALAAIGTQISDIRLAANCHLHFDHCGGNPLLGQLPVFVQEIELGTARQAPDYTLPELIEGSRFEPVTGQVEMLPGVFLVPTPGHTDGHQSLPILGHIKIDIRSEPVGMAGFEPAASCSQIRTRALAGIARWGLACR